MGISIKRIHPHFVGEVTGVDLRLPLENGQAEIIRQGMDQHGVLVFRDQDITDHQQIEYSKNFGELIETVESRTPAGITEIGNLDDDGNILGPNNTGYWQNFGARMWHTDGTFRVCPPTLSLLSARVVPSEGGNTEFAFMPAAYDALPEETKVDIEDLIAEHSLLYLWMQIGFGFFTDEQKKSNAPIRQKLVLKNASTGRKSIYLSSHIGTISGLPMPEARCLINDLMLHATQNEFVYSHKWAPGDLVMWDNRQCMHRARPIRDPTQVRELHRTTIKGESQTAVQNPPHKPTNWQVAGVLAPDCSFPGPINLKAALT